MDPNFKDSSRDSAIKRLVCCTVWHSSFNGFMAIQTQLGRFQNGTHLFSSSLSVGLRPGQKAERKWSALLDSPRRGRVGLTVIWRDPLFLYLGTFRPLLLCCLRRRSNKAMQLDPNPVKGFIQMLLSKYICISLLRHDALRKITTAKNKVTYNDNFLQ